MQATGQSDIDSLSERVMHDFVVFFFACSNTSAGRVKVRLACARVHSH